MIEVPLTKGQIAIVDDCDAWVLDYKWRAKWDKVTLSYYAVRNYYSSGHYKSVYMSRAIMGEPKGLVVDHINHDTLDNRRSNLEVKNHTGNMQNRRISKTNKSGYAGVCYDKNAGKFRADLSNSGSKKYIGLFDTPEEAARAYDREKYRLTGNILGLNFPKEYLE